WGWVSFAVPALTFLIIFLKRYSKHLPNTLFHFSRATLIAGTSLAMADTTTTPDPSTVPSPDASLAGLRVVVADGYADSAESLAWLLSLWGCQVQTVKTGTAALEAAPAFRPDVALVDLVLPE